MRWWIRRSRETDFDRELRTHLELEAEEQQQAGTSDAESRYAAQRALGNTTLIKEDTRAAWGGVGWERFAQDLRYGFRLLRRNPGFSAAIVLTLALAIGANTAMFSVIDGVLLRPLPYPQPDRLVRVWESEPQLGYFRNVVNGFNFLDWRDRNHSFEAMAAMFGLNANITGHGSPQAVPSMYVSPQFFSVLGASAYLGRTFLPEEGQPGRDQRAVLSFGLWQTYFGADRGVIGKTITVDGRPRTIVGVMPAAFSFPNYTSQLWIPLSIVRSEEWREGRFLTVLARLRPGVSLAQARQDMVRICDELARERPDYDKGWTAEVIPLLQDATTKVRLPLLVLLVAVGLVLFIACANVANLLLMRGTGRLRELAIRVSLGARRNRLTRQLLSESLVLAIAGWIAGILTARWALKGVLAILPSDSPLPRGESIHLDSRVFLFSLLLALLTVLLFGIVPALRLSNVAVNEHLKTGSLRSGVGANKRLRHAFVIAEFAFSLLLLAGAGLMLRSFQKLLTVNPGFTPRHVLTMSLSMIGPTFEDDGRRSRYLEQMLARVRGVPGVEAAGSVHFLPLRGQISGSCFALGSEKPVPSSSPDAQFLIISSGYLRAIGEPLLSGRDFNDRDRLGSPSVVLVNEAFARRFFPNRDPLGQQLNVCWTIPNPVRIVGVVANARQTDLKDAPEPTIFLPNAQAPMHFANLVVRTTGDPNQMVRSITAAIHRLDPNQALSKVQTMDDVLSDSIAHPRLQMILLLTFALMAVLLAAIGIYGVVSYSVLQRVQEIGIRVTLGARTTDVLRMVMAEGLLLAACGVIAGLIAAVFLTRLLSKLLFEVQPGDPVTLICITAILLFVAAIAIIIPARKAVRVDPVVALKYE